jgi:hypothetical protein
MVAGGELDDDDEAIRALFWKSIQSDGLAADIIMRTCADVLFAEPDNP